MSPSQLHQPQQTEINQSLLYQSPINWFGLQKHLSNLDYIQNHLQTLLLLVFKAMVYQCQEHH